MQKHRNTVLVWFFITVVIIIMFRVLTTEEIDPALKEAETSLNRKRFELKERHLERNDQAVFYGSIVAMSSLCLSVLIVAWGIHRERVKKASVHAYQIGNSSIVVHERDLSLAWPIATGLMNAEKLEKMHGGIEKAFELYATMAEVQNRQIRAYLGQRGILPALPPAPTSQPHPEALPAGPDRIPTFVELLHAGIIAPGHPLVFGYIHNTPKTGTWQDIFSNATGGQGGSGKTNTLRGLILQSLLQGVHFWILDYHWPHDESLLASLGTVKDGPYITYADKHIDYVPILEDVNRTIDRRIRKEEPGDLIKVLAIDEVLQVVQHIPFAEHMIARIGTEGRKLNIFGLFSAHNWKAEHINTSARDNLTSIFAHHMTRSQANILLQDAEQAKIVSKLRSGQMLYRPVHDDPDIVDVPWCDEEAVRLVANMVGPVSTTGNVTGNAGNVTGNVTTVGNASETPEVTGKVPPVTTLKLLARNPKFSVSKVAREMGMNKGYLSNIIKGKNPSPDALGKIETWLQQHHASGDVIPFPKMS